MKYSKITIHILVWIALIMINVFIIGGYSSVTMKEKLGVTMLIWLAYFYVNYLFLIPKFLNKRYIVLYVLLVLVVSSLSFVGLKDINRYYTEVNLSKQAIILEQYDDIKQSFEDKERVIRRMRRGDGDRARGVDPHSKAEQRGIVIESKDSVPSFTAREEEYGRVLRDYDRTRWFSRDSMNHDYNPVAFFNTSYVYTIIFLFLVSLAIAFIQKSVKADKRRSELESEKTATELAYLKQQINPHFLFNTLNAIYSYTLAVSEPASDAVIKLSSILRYMLYETNKERVPLSDEIAVVYDYIDLQKLRITDKTKVNITIKGDSKGHLIEPMLLIPILENAFKFGIDSFETSFINIEVDIRGTEFTFNVVNKIVKRGSGDKSSSGIGVKNICRRLDLIYSKSNYGLTTEDKDGIFSVTLRLNLKQ